MRQTEKNTKIQFRFGNENKRFLVGFKHCVPDLLVKKVYGASIQLPCRPK